MSACSAGSGEAADRPDEVLERVQVEFEMTRPSDGVREYYGDLFFGGGAGRDIDLWVPPNSLETQSFVAVFVIEDDSPLGSEDLEELADGARDSFGSDSEAIAVDDSTVWLPDAGSWLGSGGVTVAVHRGLGYVVLGPEEYGQELLATIRS